MGELYNRGDDDYAADEYDDGPSSVLKLGKRVVKGLALSAFSFTVVAIGYVQHNRLMARRERERKKSK